jgi:hypothetical protein
MKATKEPRKTPSNPRGKRKYKRALIDPQQIAFLTHYNDPQSPTFGNALQSALKAGYRQEYAESITHKNPQWLHEGVDRAKLLEQAEKNLQRYATQEPENDTDKKLQVDVSKFIAERVGKTYYSTRTESMNVHVNVVSEETRKQVDTALDDIL